jgi:ABC-type transport system involved in cytochrome bd biosynthesis fused ATPase/permease subunit
MQRVGIGFTPRKITAFRARIFPIEFHWKLVSVTAKGVPMKIAIIILLVLGLAGLGFATTSYLKEGELRGSSDAKMQKARDILDAAKAGGTQLTDAQKSEVDAAKLEADELSNQAEQTAANTMYGLIGGLVALAVAIILAMQARHKKA